MKALRAVVQLRAANELFQIRARVLGEYLQGSFLHLLVRQYVAVDEYLRCYNDDFLRLCVPVAIVHAVHKFAVFVGEHQLFLPQLK